MPFPFTIRYTTTLTGPIAISQQISLEVIINTLKDMKAGYITSTQSSVGYKGSSSGWNWNLFRGVDGGKFTLIEADGKLMLTYEIYFYRLFLLAALGGLWISITSGLWWFGFIAFSWLGGVNWVASWLRHRTFFRDVVQLLQ